MPTVNDVNDFLYSIAPFGMKMEFDNVGFLVGTGGSEVAKVLLSLDITDAVISEAIDIGANLVVSHHPMFFSLKSVTDADKTGEKIVRLLSGGISAICMHTNLDAAKGGVNDALAAIAGIAGEGMETELLSDDDRLPSGEPFSYGRVGCLKAPSSLSEYLEMLKRALDTNGLRYYDAGREVRKVAVVGGSGGNLFDHALRHCCDTFITADVKYDVFLMAKEAGVNLIDGDHYCTENVVISSLAGKLRTAFPGIEVVISERHSQVAKFYT